MQALDDVDGYAYTLCMDEEVEEEYGEIVSQRFECGCYFKGDISSLCEEHFKELEEN